MKKTDERTLDAADLDHVQGGIAPALLTVRAGARPAEVAELMRTHGMSTPGTSHGFLDELPPGTGRFVGEALRGLFGEALGSGRSSPQGPARPGATTPHATTPPATFTPSTPYASPSFVDEAALARSAPHAPPAPVYGPAAPSAARGADDDLPLPPPAAPFPPPEARVTGAGAPSAAPGATGAASGPTAAPGGEWDLQQAGAYAQPSGAAAPGGEWDLQQAGAYAQPSGAPAASSDLGGAYDPMGAWTGYGADAGAAAPGGAWDLQQAGAYAQPTAAPAASSDLGGGYDPMGAWTGYGADAGAGASEPLPRFDLADTSGAEPWEV